RVPQPRRSREGLFTGRRCMNAYAIPARLNLILSAATLSILLTVLFLSSKARTAAELIVLAVLFGIFMNTGYALIHEAEHGILHPNRKLNDISGQFLPASIRWRVF